MEPAPLRSVPVTNFADASEAVLAYLEQRLPLGAWAVTRFDGADQVFLHVRDRGFGAAVGDRRRWTDTFCRLATAGATPQIAPDAKAVDAYLALDQLQDLGVGAYVGVPITDSSGQLFGTICGLDRAPQPQELVDELPQLELLAGLLGQVLDLDRALTARQLQLERVADELETDALTGVRNRRGWDRRLGEEEDRARRFGDPGAVLVLDLDDLKRRNDELGHAAGDAYLRAAAAAMEAVAHPGDTVARTGGDEFALLLPAAHPAQVAATHHRLLQELQARDVRASVGVAAWSFEHGFTGAWREADAAMYRDKSRHEQRDGRLRLAGAGEASAAAG